MNSMQRVKAMVEGKEVDRIGVAAWYHMPLLDQVPKDFAKGILTSCQVMKWDVCKLQYNGLFFTWWPNMAKKTASFRNCSSAMAI